MREAEVDWRTKCNRHATLRTSGASPHPARDSFAIKGMQGKGLKTQDLRQKTMSPRPATRLTGKGDGGFGEIAATPDSVRTMAVTDSVHGHPSCDHGGHSGR